MKQGLKPNDPAIAFDNCFHGFARGLRAGHVFIHKDEHRWEVINVTNDNEQHMSTRLKERSVNTILVNAKRLTGSLKRRVFEFGVFIEL